MRKCYRWEVCRVIISFNLQFIYYLLEAYHYIFAKSISLQRPIKLRVFRLDIQNLKHYLKNLSRETNVGELTRLLAKDEAGTQNMYVSRNTCMYMSVRMQTSIYLFYFIHTLEQF